MTGPFTPSSLLRSLALCAALGCSSSFHGATDAGDAPNAGTGSAPNAGQGSHATGGLNGDVGDPGNPTLWFVSQ